MLRAMRLLLIPLFALTGYFLWVTTFSAALPELLEVSRDDVFGMRQSSE